MTPAEQCRADVEAWWIENAQYLVKVQGIGTKKCGLAMPSSVLASLLARLTPVYERKAASPYGWGVDYWRERAKRAVAKLADATAYCSGEFPCEASTAAASLERQLADAKVGVARLREAGQALHEALAWVSPPMNDRPQRALEAWREALAATERK